MLSTLREHDLYTKLSKCEFWLNQVKFLGHVITPNGVVTNPGKVEVVLPWPNPTSMYEVRSFLELVGYYRRFLEGFAKLSSPLIALVRKDTTFV